MEFGTNLSNHQFLDFLSADSPEGLKEQLDQIKLPYQVLSIYAQGVKHVAWLNLSRPIRKNYVTEESVQSKKKKRGKQSALKG
jgi:hypothetical protein